MKLSDFSIGKRLTGGFVIIGILVMITMGVLKVLRDNMSASALGSIDALEYSNMLALREMDHHIWLNGLARYLAQDGKTPLNVTKDGHACAFGQWYDGPERKHLEELFPAITPLLNSIDHPHLDLHKQAETIENLVKEGKLQEAVDFYTNTTVPNAKNLFHSFHQISDILEEEVNKDIADYKEIVKMTDIMGFVIFAIMFVISAFICYMLTNSITHPIKIVGDVSTKIANGNLNEKVWLGARKDEFSYISDSINAMVNALKTKIAESDKLSEESKIKASEAETAMQETKVKEQRIGSILGALNDLVKEATTISATLENDMQNMMNHAGNVQVLCDNQTARIEAIATTMDQINTATDDVARSASSSANLASSSLEKAKTGQTIVLDSEKAIHSVSDTAEKLEQNMSTLASEADSIGSVINVISDIADQTNLLALNAAIEAARAGEAGRGFAVVADEVRKLAEKTMHATQEVGEKISSIQTNIKSSVTNMHTSTKQVERAASLSLESGASLGEIVELANESTTKAYEIATSAEEHSHASKEVAQNLEEITQATMQVGSSMKDVSENIKLTFETMQELNALIMRMSKL